MNADDAFQLRLLKFQEGSLSPEELEAFNAELRGSPELRDAFIEQNHFAQLLREVPQISDPAAPSDSVSVAVTFALSTSVITMSVRPRAVSSV